MFTGIRLNTGGADATEESGMHDNMIGNKFRCLASWEA